MKIDKYPQSYILPIVTDYTEFCASIRESGHLYDSETMRFLYSIYRKEVE